MSTTGHAVLRKCLRMKKVMRCFPDYLQWIIDHPDEPVSRKTLQRVETRYRSLFPNARQEEEEDEENDDDDGSDGEGHGSDGEDNGSDGGSDNVDRQSSVVEMCEKIQSTSTGYFPKYIQRILQYPKDPITDKTAARVKKKYSKLIARKEEKEEEEEEDHSHEEGDQYSEQGQEVYRQEDVESPAYKFNRESNEWEDYNNSFGDPNQHYPWQYSGPGQEVYRWPPPSVSEDDENNELEYQRFVQERNSNQGYQGVPTASTSAAAARAAADAAVAGPARASGTGNLSSRPSPFFYSESNGREHYNSFNEPSRDDSLHALRLSPVPSGSVSGDGLDGELPDFDGDVHSDSD